MSRSFRFILVSLASALASGSALASSFEDAMISTYNTNPRIKQERQRQEATDEEVAQAVSGFRPTIVANYDRGRQRTDFGGTGWNYGNTNDKSLRVEQPLFRGGGTISSYNAAKQRVKAGSYDLSAVEQQIILQAVTAYMDVIANSAILELSRNNADVLAEQLRAANTRFQVGEVTRTDVAQSEARLSDAKTAVISAEGNLLGSMATFERVIGYRPSGTLTVPEHLPELPASLDEAIQMSHNANPQLLSAVHAAKGSNYDIGTNQSVLLPQISLVGSMERQDGAGSLGNSKFDQDRVAVEFTIPLYQSGAEWSRVREAKAIARQRDHQTTDTRVAVDESVTQGWEQLETAISTITTRQDQIKAAEVALEGVKQEQQYGSRTVLDILDAEQELFAARTNLVRAQRDRIVAAYNLSFTLGQLTPPNLGLSVPQYDPSEHSDHVAWKPIGF